MKAILLSILALLAWQWAAAQEENTLENMPECVMLTISGDPATHRAVSWRTAVDDTVSLAELVQLRPSPDLEEHARRVQGTHALWEEGAPDYKMGHKVNFTNLLPNTQYAYRVGNGEQWSEWFQFKTSSNEVEPFSFLYFGDIQNDIASMGSRTLRQAYTHFPDADFMLFTGDIVGRSYRDYWDEFFYAGGWLFGMMPSLPVAGNHEYYPNGDQKRPFSKHWNQIYTMPDNAPNETYRNRIYYIDYQGVRFVAVDAVNLQDEADGKMITNWLENTLQSNSCKWTVVFLHYPVYSCSQGRNSEGFRNVIKPILEKYGVDLVLQGHDHTYCRGFAMENVSKECKNPPMYVVSVGGPKMYGLNVDFWSDRMGSYTQLYQHIAIDGDVLSFQAFDVTGHLYDAFKLVKCPGQSNLFIEDEAVKSIKMRIDIPENFKERYTKDDLKKYYQRFSE